MMDQKMYQKYHFKNTTEHLIRNWLVVQRYRFTVLYHLPKKMVVFILLGVERSLSFFKILN